MEVHALSWNINLELVPKVDTLLLDVIRESQVLEMTGTSAGDLIFCT